ncbi:CYTH domain-containing protein [Saccharothrix sp. ALI-22-I]|uniref:CYTH domain-containing protein n=1 Tax=Saccharothrix sp. ALI-22-I TaxID=1933778 RepID=UPI00097BC65A|nr:CYTH domain-containing protein [Saccharothrix sp. ALI-22-I]
MQYIEVEKKYALPDADALKAKLADLGAKPGEPTRQVDAYYNHPSRDFLAPEPSRSGCASAPRPAAPRSTTSCGTPPTP